MAVTSVKVSHDGWSGSADIKEGYTFNVTYLAEVDDPQDGVYEVLSSPKMPTIGSAYEVGNDRYYLTALSNLSASPVSGTRNLWEIVGTYGRIKPDDDDEEPITKEKPTKTTAKEDDPTEWPTIVTLNTTRVSRAAQFGVYMGQKRYVKGRNQNQDVALTVGNAGTFNVRARLPQPQAEVKHFAGDITNDIAITNSNFKPFDPAPEIDYTRYNVNIAFRTVNYPKTLIYNVNSVNNDSFVINHLLETEDDNGNPRILHTKFAVAQYTAKIQGVDVTPMQSDGIGYFSVSVDIEIDELYGWRLDILDRGYSELDETLEPDGSYAAPGKTKVITDEAGNALKEPTLLDGHGRRLNPKQLDAVYLTYAVYPEIDFRDLKIHQPQLMKNLK
jgi:hypothetical protein